MSIYSDTKIIIPTLESSYGFGKRIFLDIEWHSKHPLLAISHSDDKNGTCVSIYDNVNEETTNVTDTSTQSIQLTAMKWHPLSKILSLGYDTGEVLIWNHEEGELFEGARGHSSTIMLLEWSADALLLISSDNMGILIIWKSDEQGHLQIHFIHDFKDPVCHILFRQNTFSNHTKNREDDAERALGMMTAWRPKTGRNRTSRNPPSSSDVKKLSTPDDLDEKGFFVGVLSGTIYFLKESGSNEEILSSGSSIRSLLFHSAKDLLIILTEAQIMGHFRVSPNGDLIEVNKMKVGGRGDMHLFWVGNATLAVIGKDPTVRLWDIETAQNLVIEPKPHEVGEDESFLSLDYHPKDGILCCCTNKGKLVMWKEVEPPVSEEGENRQVEEDHWEALSVTVVPSSSKSAKWCFTTNGTMAVNALQDILLLREQELCFHFGHQVSVVQSQPTVLSLQLLSERKSFDIQVDMQITGLTASEKHLVIWNGNKVVTYEFGSQLTSNYKLVGNFANKSDTILVQEMSLYLQELGQVQVRTFQGTIKQTLAFSGNEGPPITISLGGDFLTCGSECGYIKIWHIGRREAKLHTVPKNLHDHIENLGEIRSANTNCSGTKLGFTVAKVNLIPDSNFYVMDLLNGGIQEINFPSKFIEKFFWECEHPAYVALEVRSLCQELEAISEEDVLRKEASSSRLQEKKEKPRVKYIKPCSDIRRPWKRDKDEGDDEEEQRTGVGNKSYYKKTEESDKIHSEVVFSSDHGVITLFADSEKGILLHEKRVGDEIQGKFLVGLEVPYIYFAENGAFSTKKPSLKELKGNASSLQSPPPPPSLKIRIDKQTIPEFDGVEDDLKEGRAALMQYVYHTLFNDIDGALRAIRFIKNEKIYSNLVRNCVKTKRMDIALLCLAKMKQVRIAREIRVTMENEAEPQTHAAILAVQLGMMEEAEQLYKEINRPDLLLELFIAGEMWDKAVALCEKHQRIQLRSTYHACAKSLEFDKKIPEAMQMYEKAETHRIEVPRMLIDDPDQLQAYVMKKKDKDLYHWWAQYLESTGDIEKAQKFYELAQDWLSLVRLLCYLQCHDKAVQVANKVDDKASAYHLARTLEDNGEIVKAINFFFRAGAYGHGIRMCISNHLPDELWALALKATPSEQAEAAKYFETVHPPMYDKAIQLYHRAGYESKALDLAFSSQEFSALQNIVKDIMNKPALNTDPLLLQKCADFFVQNNEIEKALDMLCAAQKYPEAMDLCITNNFTINDELAERLTAPKGIGLNEQTRIKLLEKMGECCTIQGNYHLAAKKYTQAGNKVEAIKSLVKSGDTDRIIFYANVSRHRDIYMIAAHYLQTTEWLNNPKTIETIIQYYTKAQALESLAGFYETVAESEIEVNRDYQKALDEYRKASLKWKDLLACGARQYEDRYKIVEKKINYIGKFLGIVEMIHREPDAGLLELRKLIEDPKSELGVRTGDIYALIIDHYVEQGELEQALALLEPMKSYTGGKSLTNFLSAGTTAKLEKALQDSDILMRIRSGGGHGHGKKTISSSSSSAKDENFMTFLSSNGNNLEQNEESEEVEEDELEDDEEEEGFQ